jgi:hypothetical protein
MLNFNWKQYLLSGILLILIFVLGIQINYNRQDETEILNYLPSSAVFLLKLDLAVQNKNCLLGHWCFIDEQSNEFLAWLENDSRPWRLLESLTSKTDQLASLASKINSQTYLIGLTDSSSEDLDFVFLIRQVNFNSEISQELIKNGFFVKRQGGWLIFSDDQEQLDLVLAKKDNSSIYFDNFNQVGLDKFSLKHQPFVRGFINRQAFVDWSARQDGLAYQELNMVLNQKNLPATISLLAWFRNQKVDFMLVSGDMLREASLDKTYTELKFDPLFKLQPQIIIEKSKIESSPDPKTAIVFSHFGLNKYVEPSHWIWMNLVNLEKDFDAQQILAQSQILILPALEDKVDINLKNAVTLKLAQLLPSERDLILPDKTVVTELVADPQSFEFAVEEVRAYQLEFLSQPSVNFEFAMASDGIKTILADSKDILSSFIYSYGDEVDKIWQAENSADKVFFNFSNQQKSFYGLEDVLIEDFSWGNNIWLMGEVR